MRDDKPTPRQVLSANLRSLMAASKGRLGTIKKVAEASRDTLSNGKVGRIYAASHTTDIETLQHLADVFDLAPWQLLVPGLNPEALPRLADAAMLGQILDAVQRQQTEQDRVRDSQPPAHQVEDKGQRVSTETIDRLAIFTEGEEQGAQRRSSSSGVPKQGTRRSVQGADAARRKR